MEFARLEVGEMGLNQRRVREGEMREEFRIENPARERSVRVVYIPRALGC